MSVPSPNRIEVPVDRLDIGMYVTDLDRPWLETPFALQGFYVQSLTDIETLSEYCQFVYVDPRRANRGEKRARYHDTVAMRDEFHRAETDLTSAHQVVSRVFERVNSGAPLEVANVCKAINPLIDSVLRNKDAMAALVRMRTKDDYTYGHSLSTAVWSAILGRHIGLDKEDLGPLALGAALIDVGKVRVDAALLAKGTKLSPDEVQAVRAHVTYSLEIVSAANVDQPVLDIVRHHHERHDGSGYPKGLSGTDIPLLARIVGLADSYDAMITPRPYAVARSSFDAMQELSDLKGTKYQSQLVEQFMQAVGLFPTGSLVELNTGEVGIVTTQNTTRRLKPVVMVVLGPDKKRLKKFLVVDLAGHDAIEGNLWIAKELAPGTYGVDAEEFYL